MEADPGATASRDPSHPTTPITPIRRQGLVSADGTRAVKAGFATERGERRLRLIAGRKSSIVQHG